MLPDTIIPAFDAYLANHELSFDAVVIGGSALVLLGVVQRATEDCDVLDPQIPDEVVRAARAFARERQLDDDWLNARAHDFVQVPGCLPEGWRDRLRWAFADCVALAPTLDELRTAWPFVVQYEGNPESREGYWLPLARRQLARLAKELGYDAVF